MPKIQHSLGDVIAALNSKIAQLEKAKHAVQREIDRGHYAKENGSCLQQINDSLKAAESAKTLMQDSCCSSQSCDFEYLA